jgi:hypothetical protein
MCIDFDMRQTEVKLLAIADRANVKARQYEWHSWAWRCSELAKAKTAWPAAIRGIVSSKEMSLAECVATCGWWDLDHPMLKKVAAQLHIDVEDESELLTILLVMTGHVLKCDDGCAMRCIAHRLDKLPPQDSERMKILLEVDEAAQCLLEDEEQALQSEKKKNERKKDALHSFRNKHVDFSC